MLDEPSLRSQLNKNYDFASPPKMSSSRVSWSQWLEGDARDHLEISAVDHTSCRANGSRLMHDEPHIRIRDLYNFPDKYMVRTAQVSTSGFGQKMELPGHDELFEEHRKRGRCARKLAPCRRTIRSVRILGPFVLLVGQ